MWQDNIPEFEVQITSYDSETFNRTDWVSIWDTWFKSHKHHPYSLDRDEYESTDAWLNSRQEFLFRPDLQENKNKIFLLIPIK